MDLKLVYSFVLYLRYELTERPANFPEEKEDKLCCL